MHKQFDRGLMWFRRDLRVPDNAALSLALQHCREVHCLFVLDRDILDPLPRVDRRVAFILETLRQLDQDLRTLSGKPDAGLIVRHGQACAEVVAVARSLGVQAVFAAKDYEPGTRARDAATRGALADAGVALYLCKDHVVFEERELLTQGGTPFAVFTPYKNKWLTMVTPKALQDHDTSTLAEVLVQRPASLRHAIPTLADIGFQASTTQPPLVPSGVVGAQRLLQDFLPRIDRYDETRDFPAVKGPSYLSTHLRFGTVSIRHLASLALQRSRQGSHGAATWLGELIWRDFYFQVLANHPHVVGGSFKPAYDAIAWEHGKHAQAMFAAWCMGQTGYPLVDAAMAQLNQTGYMHNRLRMVAASFLIKDLGIDWRWGEKYFAEKLNDFDLAANNGGWQWVSSSGCDAQPYFRIFNPISQSEKFDPTGKFIRRYLPQLSGLSDTAIHAPWKAKATDLQSARIALGRDYPEPIVQHAQARTRTLLRYAVVK